jgi:pyruvate/2-oxoglutarate dehydrogenase complex dihydrolipoamide acyltransferase (E2) component
LSYDHRVINGVEAGEFMVDLKIELEEKVKW